MERHIAHLDQDTFFVSVERLTNSKLNGMPILIGGTADRGVVASCSYEARAFGVHSAMPMRLARKLCPEAIVVRPDFDSYSKYSKLVTDILIEAAPLVEKASIDEHYLDLTGMDKYFGCYKWLHELRGKLIRETGLPISLGLSVNKTVSKIATGQAKPNGELNIAPGLERGFLAPLPSRKIPMVGAKTYQILSQLKLQTIGIIQQMPRQMMYSALGENGISIWNKANAIDNCLVVPHREQKGMSGERTFQSDTIDMAYLKKVLLKIVDELSFQLRKENRLTGCVAVKIRYSNFETHTEQKKIAYSSSDAELSKKVWEIFTKAYSRRMLIRLVGVRFTDLVSGNRQIDLFNDATRDINLNSAMDGIRNRFGTNLVMRAALL